MKFTPQQKFECGKKYEVADSVQNPPYSKKNKKKSNLSIQTRLEYPLVIALNNRENIKIIEELVKVTPLTFLQEKDEHNQTVFIKIFRRAISPRPESEEIYIVDLLVSSAQKKHIAIDWLAQDTFF